MKRLLLICGAAALLCACQPKGFVLDGSIDNAEGAKVSLIGASTQQEVNNARIEKGKLRMEGSVDAPGRYILQIDTNDPDTPSDKADAQKIFATDFYLENSKIAISADTRTLPTIYWQEGRVTEPALVTGSRQEELRRALDERRKEVNARLNGLYKRMSEEYYIPLEEGRAEEARKAGVEIVRAEQQAQDERTQIMIEFAREHPEAAVSFDEISYLMGGLTSLTAAEVDEYLAILAPAWEGTPQFEQLKGLAGMTKRLAVGEPYIDCEFYNLDGEKVKLSTVIPQGRYVMLEFWASWCGPCRGEIPHLKHIREVYPDFDIVSVSVDDKDADWKRALKEEKMDWVQLRDEGFTAGKAFSEYQVMGIPCCIVLDPQGRFCKVNMRGAYLDAFLQELYGR